MFEVLVLMLLQEGLLRLFMKPDPSRSKRHSMAIFFVINILVISASIGLYNFQRLPNLYDTLNLDRHFSPEQLRRSVQLTFPKDPRERAKVTQLLSHPVMINMYEKYNILQPQDAVNTSNESRMYGALLNSAVTYGILVLIAVWGA